MKFTLFSKELFGGKKKLIMFIVVSLLIYILIGMQLVLSAQTSATMVVPDLTFAGKPMGETVLFEKYFPIKSGYKEALESELNNTVNSYSFAARNIITVQKENSLEDVTYTLYGCEHSFFVERLTDLVQDGIIPEKSKKQAIVGGYFAKAFDIKIGDVITNKSVELNNIGSIDVSLDLSGNYQEIPYEVVGILQPTDKYFDYSILIESETQPSIQANTTWTYFLDSKAKDLYLEKIVNGDSSLFSDYEIGFLSESYQLKDNSFLSQILNQGYIFILVIIFTYLLISYILKGITHKLGIIKAIGISNRYIYSCYYVGITVIQLFSFFISTVTMHFMCKGINTFISQSYGYEVVIYKVTLNMILILGAMFVVTIISLWLILQYKINRVSPKVAMTTQV